jgi:membrane protein
MAALKRAALSFQRDNMTMFASALAYSSLLAIPAVLLVVVGLFTLVAGPGTIDSLIKSFEDVMPNQATQLLGDNLHRLNDHPSTGIAMTVVGTVLAVWSTTSAMTSYMTAINVAYERQDSRSFVRKRAIALVMAACIAFAFLLVAGLLVLGPQIEKRVGSALGAGSLTAWIWWAAQWPILLLGLLAAFATLLYLAPDISRDDRRFRLITPGAALATVVWLVISGAFAVYTSRFGSYDKTWGSLSAVIVTMVWLWLSSLALLFGAEVNSELEAEANGHR